MLRSIIIFLASQQQIFYQSSSMYFKRTDAQLTNIKCRHSTFKIGHNRCLYFSGKGLSHFLYNCFFGLNSCLTGNNVCILLRGPVKVNGHKYRQVVMHSFCFFFFWSNFNHNCHVWTNFISNPTNEILRKSSSYVRKVEQTEMYDEAVAFHLQTGKIPDVYSKLFG